jgi:uncharacterized membrane protein YccC
VNSPRGASAGGLRAALISSLAVDRSGFAPLVALRGAAGVAIPFAIGAAAGHPAEGAIAGAGALPAGVAGMGGWPRNNSALVIGTTIGMAASTFVGGLVAGHTVTTVLVLAAWAFAAGLVVVLGREASVVGTQAVLGLVVFGRFPGSVASSAAHAGWVLAGGGFQAVLAFAIRPPQRFGAERRTLAAAYAELAQLARDPNRPAISAASEAAMSTTLLRRRTPSEDVELLRGLSDEADRIRLELQALATVLEVPAVREVRQAAASRLDSLAVAIRAGETTPVADESLARLVEELRARRDAAPVGRRGTPTRFASARATALLGQLRAADRLTNALAGVRRLVLPRTLGAPAVVMLPRRAADSWRQLVMTARDPHSSAFRHAVRLGVMLPIAEAVSRALPWQRGYWVTLTTMVVLKPDYAATAQRGVARIGGTALGVGAAGLLVVAIHPSGGVLALLIGLATWSAYATFGASYALYSITITALVVLLLTPLGGSELSTVADRGLDTLLGGALALGGYALWPTWEAETLTVSTSRLLTTLASYARTLLSAYADPDSVTRADVAAAAAAARRARIAAQSSLSRAVAEPPRAGADTDTAAGVLAAARRIVIALHALRATLDDATESVAVPEVSELRDAIATALDDLAAGRHVTIGELRDKQQALESDEPQPSAAVTLHARRRALLAAHLDPLVDSVDTLAHVLSSEQPQPD